MVTRFKDVVLKMILVVIAAFAVAVVLLVPGIVVFKLIHGASKLACSAVFAGYIGSWIGLLLCLARFRKEGHDAALGIVWGLCFVTLLLLSWRL